MKASARYYNEPAMYNSKQCGMPHSNLPNNDYVGSTSYRVISNAQYPRNLRLACPYQSETYTENKPENITERHCEIRQSVDDNRHCDYLNDKR